MLLLFQLVDTMNFKNLFEPNCGQRNPLSQLAQHVTEDQRFQETTGNPHTHGLNQNNSMPPQFFRIHGKLKLYFLSQT